MGAVEELLTGSTEVIDAKGELYACPGFIDAHLHVESSMVTVTEFARAALPHGTTCIIIDPHEIANVLGAYGVKLFLRESEGLPLDVYITVPSCVPAAPSFETSGAELDPSDVAALLKETRAIALAEMMNFPGVLMRDRVVMAKIEAAKRLRKRVNGHAPMLRGDALCSYLAAGVHSDHECVGTDEALEKLRLGMWIVARKGTVTENLAPIVRMAKGRDLDTRRIMLASDDVSPISLLKGHVDALVRRAIESGCDPVEAIQMATINTATYFRFDDEVGVIAPGLKANIVLLRNLERVDVETTIAAGEIAARRGKLVIEISRWKAPERARRTMNLKRVPDADDLSIKAPAGAREVTARAIRVEDGSIVTRCEEVDMPVIEGSVEPDPRRDVLMGAVVERHRATGNVGLGFVRGFGLRRGALASSVAHDSHNIVGVGADRASLAAAIGEVVHLGGGVVVADQKSILATLPLPVAGLMSDRSINEVATQLERLHEAARRLGCKLTEPFMTMSFLALSVIPELKLTDRGLVRHDPVTKEIGFVSLLVETSSSAF